MHSWFEGSKHRRGIKIFARRGAPVDRRQRRQDRPRRRDQAPRQVRPAPGHLRQHLHVRAPGEGREELPGAAPAHDDAEAGREGARAARPRTPRRPRPPPRPRRRRRKRTAAQEAAEPPRRRAARPSSPPRRRRRSRTKQRLFAHPQRPNAGRAGGEQQEFERTGKIDGSSSFKSYFTQGLRPRPQGRPHQAPAPGLARRGRHRPRPHRQGRRAQGAAHAVRDPPGRPRRPAHRPEADPRRLEAARVDRDLPRGRQEPVLRPGRQAARRSARSC